MVKLNNISSSIMSNPLVGVVCAIFLLLIVLAVVRMFQPDFSMGAKLEGHFGTLDGKINLEAFQPMGVGAEDEDDQTDNTTTNYNPDGSGTENFNNELSSMPTMPAFD